MWGQEYKFRLQRIGNIYINKFRISILLVQCLNNMISRRKAKVGIVIKDLKISGKDRNYSADWYFMSNLMSNMRHISAKLQNLRHQEA